MAVLSDNDRAEVWAQWMRDNADTVGAMTKSDLRAAANALDDFLNTNATAINNAIPQPARGVLSTSQKARLLMLVIQRRYIAGA